VRLDLAATSPIADALQHALASLDAYDDDSADGGARGGDDAATALMPQARTHNGAVARHGTALDLTPTLFSSYARSRARLRPHGTDTQTSSCFSF